MGKLEGKVAVITGGSSGIGLATARRFVAEGAYVFVTGRRQKELDAAVKAIGNDATGVQGDIANLADLDRLVEVVRAGRGRVDVVVANAGVSGEALLAAVTEQQFDNIFGVNVKGTLFTVQKLLPLLTDGASIILIGSIASVKGFEGYCVYNASKAAVRSFARTWAAELKGRKIRVNVLSPGPVETEVFDHLPKGAKASFEAIVPRGTLGRPDEIAAAAVFLASDDSSFVNGVELFVDGGTAQT
jgi:NAD(P)-dependent dehydrogenase (short-subunit alcohol dehydrogenase family)